MLTIDFFISKCEWQYIEREAETQSFKDGNSFVISRMRKVGAALPLIAIANVCEKERKQFRIYDEEVIRRLTSYCDSQKINPSTFMRRLVLDPVVRKHLLGEALALQD